VAWPRSRSKTNAKEREHKFVKVWQSSSSYQCYCMGMCLLQQLITAQLISKFNNFRNSKFQHHVHKGQQLVPILSPLNPFRTFYSSEH
jgi:hypothetical protein